MTNITVVTTTAITAADVIRMVTPQPQPQPKPQQEQQRPKTHSGYKRTIRRHC